MKGRAGLLATAATVAVVVGGSAFAALQWSDGSSSGAGSTTSSPASRFSDGKRDLRGCRERIEGRFLEPDPATDTTIGPITFTGAPASYRDYASRRDSELEPFPGVGMPAMKIIALLRSGARVTLVVPHEQRRWMRLLYLRPGFPRGTYRATLHACRGLATRRAQRSECGWGPRLESAEWACRSRYTQFSGGFALDFANAPQRGQCAELIARTRRAGLREFLFDPAPEVCGVDRRPTETRLLGAPAAITNACARAASHAAFPVLCPARWPSPRGRSGPRARLFERASDVYPIDAENGFSRRGGHVFHLLVGGQRQAFGRWPAGVDPDLRVTTRKLTTPIRGGGTFVQQLPARRIASARVHGALATVLREPSYPEGGLHGGHVVVLWSENGHGYLLSVHGQRLSQRALVSIGVAMARSTRRRRSVPDNRG